MSVCIYQGGADEVWSSGVGRALEHQAAALKEAGLPLVEKIPPAGPESRACVVHLNTTRPGALLAAARAHARGCKVVYYGHRTAETARWGSRLMAPLVRRWLALCYRQGDLVITPSVYASRVLAGYKIGRPIYTLSNGIDTGFFRPDAAEFTELARRMPEVRFIWFGRAGEGRLTDAVREAMDAAPGNVLFAGYVPADELRDAYCGADAFVFLSHQETEGISVLEALACGTPTLVRDIPVYDNWLEEGKSVYKADSLTAFARKLQDILAGHLPSLREGGLAVAQARSLYQIGQALCRIYASSGLLEAAKTTPEQARALPRPTFRQKARIHP